MYTYQLSQSRLPHLIRQNTKYISYTTQQESYPLLPLWWYLAKLVTYSEETWQIAHQLPYQQFLQTSIHLQPQTALMNTNKPIIQVLLKPTLNFYSDLATSLHQLRKFPAAMPNLYQLDTHQSQTLPRQIFSDTTALSSDSLMWE